MIYPKHVEKKEFFFWFLMLDDFSTIILISMFTISFELGGAVTGSDSGVVSSSSDGIGEAMLICTKTKKIAVKNKKTLNFMLNGLKLGLK